LVESLDSKSIGQLIKSAAEFAAALEATGNAEELKRRAAEYVGLTAPGSPFRNAYREAETELATVPADVANRLWAFSRPRPSTIQFFLTAAPKDDAERTTEDSPLGPTLFPGCLDELPLGLSDLLKNAEWLLAQDPRLPCRRAILERWRDEIASVIQRGEDWLLGSYLIADCHAVYHSNPCASAEINTLVSRLQSGRKELIPAIRMAALSLYESAFGQEKAPGRPWYHDPSEGRPQEFQHGPITNNLAQLARLVGPSFGSKRPDRRIIERLAKQGLIWVNRRGRSQTCEVYFTNLKTYAEIHAAELTAGNKQKEA
jgi:hypothetical protein